MTHPPPCPIPDCTSQELHAHAMLGEGMFGSRAQDELPAGEPTHGLSPIKDVLRTLEVPCRCRCGARFQGLQFTPLKAGETERLRTCPACLDRLADAVEARHASQNHASTGKPSSYRDSQPLRTPYRDD